MLYLAMGQYNFSLEEVHTEGLVLWIHRFNSRSCIRAQERSEESLNLFGYSPLIDSSRERAIIKGSHVRLPPSILFGIVDLELRARKANTTYTFE